MYGIGKLTFGDLVSALQFLHVMYKDSSGTTLLLPSISSGSVT
jgi:hypothetical protein